MLTQVRQDATPTAHGRRGRKKYPQWAARRRLLLGYEEPCYPSLFSSVEPEPLVERLIDMDDSEERELEELYHAAYGSLVGELAALTGSSHLAEEAVQEAFIQLIPQWHKVRTYHAPRAWLRRVATHRAIDQLRRSRRDRRLRDQLSKTTRHRAHEDHYPSASGVSQALAELDLNHRQVLLLKAWEGMSVEGIAAQLDIPEGTVKSRLSRARTALHSALQEGNRNV